MALVLTRTLNQMIRIGRGVDAITIKVTKIKGSKQVSLAIDADPSIPIKRVELDEEAA